MTTVALGKLVCNKGFRALLHNAPAIAVDHVGKQPDIATQEAGFQHGGEYGVVGFCQ